MENEHERPPSLLQQVLTDQKRNEQIAGRLVPYIDQLSENAERVNRLLIVIDNGLNDPQSVQDILRAAVVFIHAYLEDFLRTLAVELLPAGDEACLKDIPLAGSGSFGRSEKFVLGQLAQHKGKTVDELLTQSVSDYFGRSNFNSTAEIGALLRKLGFTLTDHNCGFEEIDGMIKRRHQIVHRADRIKDQISGTYLLQSIERSDVTRWLQVTLAFTSGLIKPLLRRLQELVKLNA